MRRPQRQLNRLNTKKVEALLRTGGRPMCDGQGLWLVASSMSAASWVFRYRFGGVDRSVGLGSARRLSLAEARAKAEGLRKLLDADKDPQDDRPPSAAAVPIDDVPALTFEACAQAYIDANSPHWKNSKHIAQWSSTLETYAYPVIGRLDVRNIATSHLLEILEPIWREKPETAGRLRGRIEAVLNRAKAIGRRDGENPARWQGHLQNLLPARSKVRRTVHHASMPYVEVGAFVQKLRAADSTGARALEYLILTAARTGEVLGTTWSELDEVARVWTVPAERMKTSVQHRSPLPGRCLEILKAQRLLTNGTGFVFPGRDKGKHLSNMALLAVMSRLGESAYTGHGFRSSFRDWAAERTNFPREVCEEALSHTNRDRVEAAYRRSDLFEKRRRLMDAWANFINSTAVSASVVPMRRAAD